MFNLTPFNLITAVLLGLSVWLGMSRFRIKLESNWPLFYYLFLFGHLKVFDGGLDPYMVYIGLVSALLLRFEFIGGWFLKTIRFVEIFVLAYVIWRCFGLIMMW